MFKNSKKTILNAGRALGLYVVCLALFSTFLQAQNTHSDSSAKKRSLYFGVGIGMGYTTVRGDIYGHRALIRPSASLMIQHKFLGKNQLLYKVTYRSFGRNYRPYVVNNIGYNSYFQLQFAGFSATYLRAIGLKKSFWAGVGFSGERLLQDRTVTVGKDGSRYSYANSESYNSMNWGGHLVGQYQFQIAKHLKTTIELEYSLGVSNLLAPVAIQLTGRQVYSNGLFLNAGVFF